MKPALTIVKQQLVNVPLEYQEEEGCVAFQMVKITYSYFGNEITEMFDTKILADGKQFIKDGNGFIKGGFEIN